MEIPLFIVPKDTISTACLDALAELPKILSQEEQEAYNKAVLNTGGEDLLTTVHNGAGKSTTCIKGTGHCWLLLKIIASIKTYLVSIEQWRAGDS